MRKIKNKANKKRTSIIATFMLIILLASIIPATFAFAEGKGETVYEADCEITMDQYTYKLGDAIHIKVKITEGADKVEKVEGDFIRDWNIGDGKKIKHIIFENTNGYSYSNRLSEDKFSAAYNWLIEAILIDKSGEEIGKCFSYFTVGCESKEPCPTDKPKCDTSGIKPICIPDTPISTTELLEEDRDSGGLMQTALDKLLEKYLDEEAKRIRDYLFKEEKIKKDIKEKADAIELAKEKAKEELAKAKEEAEDIKKKVLAVSDPIDRFFTIVSAIRGAWVGWVLARKAGTCDVEEPWTADKSVCFSCNDPGMFCTAERCRILGTSCRAAPTEDADRVVCVKAECLTSGRPKITEINAEAYIDLFSGPVKKASITVSGYKDTEGGIEISDWNSVGTGNEVPWDATSMIIDIKTQAQSEQTDPPVTQCRWSYEKSKGYDEMESFDIETFAENHTLTLDIRGLATNQDYSVWIKCKDVCGAVPAPEENPYWIKFKIQEEPDWVAPCYPDLPTAHENEKCFIDPYNVYVPADLDEQEIKFWLDENGVEGDACRYSTGYETDVPNFTTTWSEMHKFDEVVSPIIKKAGECKYDQKCLGYEPGSSEYEKCAHCNTFLNLNNGLRIDLTLTQEELQLLDPTLTQEEIQDILDLMDMFGYTGEVGMFKLMIVCQDEDGNEADPYLYTLLTMPPYDLVIEQPMDPLEDSYDLHPPINVTTSHDTECKYAVQNLSDSTPKAPPWDDMTFIDDNYAVNHLGAVIEELKGLPNGKQYKFWAKCRDEGRLEVENYTKFSLKKDILAPIVIRMYHASDTTFGAFGDNLVIETNEEAECVYGTSKDIKCRFNFSDGTAFTKDTEGFLHSAYWQLDSLYYIKCKDKWGNYPGQTTQQSTSESDKPWCTTIINPYEVPAI